MSVDASDDTLDDEPYDPFESARGLLAGLDWAAMEIAIEGPDAVNRLTDWLQSTKRRPFALKALTWAAGMPEPDTRVAAIGVLTRAKALAGDPVPADLTRALRKAQQRHWRAKESRAVGRMTVVITGSGPIEACDLMAYAPPHILFYGDGDLKPGTWIDVVAVGTRGWSKESIDAALEAPEPPRFLPIDGLVDEFVTGNDWWFDRPDLLNAALETHAGLQYARSLVWFEWPDIEAPESSDAGPDIQFRNSTPLFRMGYQNPSGHSAEERWRILEHAVEQLGLREVAETIAQNTRLRKTQHGGRDKYHRAIAAWEHDLARLKATHYDARRAGFYWPSTEP